MDPSRYFRKPFEDFKAEFADQLQDELVKIRNALESKNFFLPYLGQVNAAYPHNDVYVGKYGVLLLYYFLDKKFPGKFRQHLLNFYSSVIGRSGFLYLVRRHLVRFFGRSSTFLAIKGRCRF